MSRKSRLPLEDLSKLDDYLESTNIFISSAIQTSLERAFINVPSENKIDSCAFLKMSTKSQFMWLQSVSSGKEDELRQFILRKFYQLLNWTPWFISQRPKPVNLSVKRAFLYQAFLHITIRWCLISAFWKTENATRLDQKSLAKSKAVALHYPLDIYQHATSQIWISTEPWMKSFPQTAYVIEHTTQ